MGVFFNGRLIVTPAVATKIDDSGMASRNLSVPNNLAIIGQAAGGEPTTVNIVGSALEAEELYTSGELVDAIEKAFAPSSETYSPQYIYALRVQPSTVSRFVLPQEGGTTEIGTLQDIGDDDPDSQIRLDVGVVGVIDSYYNGYRIIMTSGPAKGETNLITAYDADTQLCDVKYAWKSSVSGDDTYELTPASLVLVSTDYGVHTNRVKAKIQDGIEDGTKYLAATFDDDEYIVDSLGATYFNVQYTGDEASALLVIEADQVVFKAGDLDAEKVIATAELSSYNTVSKLVDFLDSQDYVTATANTTYSDYDTEACLDYETGKDIKTTDTEITANLQVIVDWFNGSSEPFMEAYRPTESGVVPENMTYTYLYGGTTTTATTSDWQDCFDALQTEDVQCIVPLTASESVHAMALTHCQYMSNSGGLERRAIVGGAIGETVDEGIARAYSLNHDRIYLVAPGYKEYDDDDVLTTIAPYMAAAILGGMITGSDPGTSLTNKTITVSGLETKLRIPTDTDEMINGGVIALAETRTGYKVVQSVSTWLSNGNYNRVEMGTGFAVDYVCRTVRTALEALIGQKGTPSILARAVSITENALKELARPAPLGPEVITGDDDSPAYKNITAELEGDVLRVYFQCSPVVPVNYIPVGISIVPYSGSATTTSSTSA